MASTNLHCHILLPLLFVFLFNVSPCLSFDPPTQQKVNKICQQTEDPVFCSQTFTRTVTTPSADFVQLNKVTLDETNANAAGTQNLLVLLVAKETDVQLKQAFLACQNSYSVIQRAFQEATGNFNKGDYGSMLKSENAAPTAESSCRGQFSPPIEPLKENNRQIRVLIAMAAATGHELLGV